MATYAREGLRVTFTRIAGLTADGLLDSAYRFQNPPTDEFSREIAFNQATYDTLRTGQFSRKGGRQLRTSSWSSLAVDVGVDSRGMPTPGFVMLNRSPTIGKLIDGLHDLVMKGTPFMFTATHHFPSGSGWNGALTGPEVRWPATLTRVKITEKAGEGDARYFDLDLVEYRDPVAGRSGRGGISFPAHVILRADGFAYDSKTGHKLGAGHHASLSQIARHYYHDPSSWKNIAAANHLRGVSANGNLVWGIDGHGGVVHLRGKATKKLVVPKPAVTKRSR